jgi:CubicO group peptidase (beta-lactamase class C family)
MTTTFPTNTTERVSTRALGYTGDENARIADDWKALRPSGGFLSTVLDLARWDAMLATDTILTEATRRQMWTPVRLNNGSTYHYGFGWELDSLNTHKQVHHGGAMPGFRSQFARIVDEKLTIIVLMNADDVDRDSIVRGIAELYLPVPVRAR